MSLFTFSRKVKSYLKAAGHTQKALAQSLGFEHTVLNHKLNGTGRTILTHPEVKEIVKALAELEIITGRRQALELLAEMDCPTFSAQEWQSRPLSGLQADNLPPPVYPGSAILYPAAPAPVRPPAAYRPALPTNLPLQLTSFIGRVRELAEAAGFLENHVRLLTLTGPGGTGKTRLALHLAGEMLGRFPDGCWFVELASLSDPALLPQTVAAALQVRAAPGQPVLAALLNFLRDKKLLLVLDNCEHLLQAAAELAQTLLQSCRDLKVVATSREGLGIGGEKLYPVPALARPEDLSQLPPLSRLTQYEAVKLFIERAAAVRPGFELNNHNAFAVAQICYRLDGVPLAIELAAARLASLSAAQISERLNDRFRLLKGSGRPGLPRHKTLKALIDWSYDLLEPAEQQVFSRCGVFSGGWSLEAAEALCAGPDLAAGEVLDLVARLVNKSLIYNEGEARGETRFNMLETLRQYALEKLEQSGAGQKEAAFLNHGRYYLKLVEATRPSGRPETAAREAWLSLVRAEIGNLRAALARAIELAELEIALKLAESLTPYWDWEGQITEAIALTGAALAAAEKAAGPGGGDAAAAGRPAGLGRLQENLAGWLALTGRNDEAHELFRLALAAAPEDDVISRARLTRKIGTIRPARWNYAASLALLDQAESLLLNSIGPDDRAGWEEWLSVQLDRASIYYEQNDLPAIEQILSGMKTVLDRFGSAMQRDLFFPSIMLSYLYRLNRYIVTDEQLDYARTLTESFRQAGTQIEIINSRFRLGFSLLWHLDYEEAGRVLLECLSAAERIGDVSLQARCLTYLSVAGRRRGLVEETRQHLDRLDAVNEIAGMKEYEGVSRANRGWLQWRQGEFALAWSNLKAALSLWSEKQAGTVPAYPFRWLALWPLIALALHNGDLPGAHEYTRELLRPEQQRVPAELETLLEAIHREYEQGNLATTAALLDQAVALAKDLDYL